MPRMIVLGRSRVSSFTEAANAVPGKGPAQVKVRSKFPTNTDVNSRNFQVPIVSSVSVSQYGFGAASGPDVGRTAFSFRAKPIGQPSGGQSLVDLAIARPRNLVCIQLPQN